MTPRSERLNVVQKVAEGREQTAAREMAKARTRMEETEKRLNELILFREEYERNLMEKGSAGMNVLRMREYHLFLSRLEQATTFQRNTLEQSKLALAHKQRAWEILRGRVVAIEKLITRYQQQEQLDNSRREQKDSDEYAGRAARRNDF